MADRTSTVNPYSYPAGSSTAQIMSRALDPKRYTATAYGSKPQATPMPSTTYQQTQNVLPQLPAMTTQAGQDVMGQLQGTLSPETLNMIQNHAAQFGVQMGVPGSEFAGASGLRQLGLTTEQVQNMGLQNYGNLLTNISRTQLDPSLAANINTQNALWASAPDPAAAARANESNYILNARLGQSMYLDQLQKQYELAAANTPAPSDSTNLPWNATSTLAPKPSSPTGFNPYGASNPYSIYSQGGLQTSGYNAPYATTVAYGPGGGPGVTTESVMQDATSKAWQDLYNLPTNPNTSVTPGSPYMYFGGAPDTSEFDPYASISPYTTG